MDRSQNKSRGKRSSSRESAQRAKRFHSSDEEEFDDVVCDLNVGDYTCTDESVPYCEISHEVSAPHVHQNPREGPEQAETDSYQDIPQQQSSAAASTYVGDANVAEALNVTTYAGDINIDEYARLFTDAVKTDNYEQMPTFH